MKKRIFVTIVLIMSIFLTACESQSNQMNGNYNSYQISESESFFESENGTLQTIKIENENISFSYQNLDGTSHIDSGKITIKDNSFKTEGGQSGTLEIVNEKLVIEWKNNKRDSADSFDKEGSDGFKENERAYNEDIEFFNDLSSSSENEEDFYDEEESSSESNQSVSHEERNKLAETASKKIIDSLKTEVVGKWKSGTQSTMWETGTTIELTNDGKITITEIMPEPDYMSIDLTYSGGYSFDENALISDLMEHSDDSNVFREVLDLKTIDSYEDYVDFGKGEVPINVSLERTGTIHQKEAHKQFDSSFYISYVNTGLKTNELNFFEQFKNNSYTRV
ncbi:hypothetical protein P7E02_06440 [Enterococcus hulanensis]|uniref:hypothetical protein n=1 Tax=Enterococcus hulanensis TaxID=2559929 RepID=UPI00288C7E61|nr:hypothetical protein [Enterococcus hulanensis]MDT2659497.1 hypothetical protein [Enterococcus hulanensis]